MTQKHFSTKSKLQPAFYRQRTIIHMLFYHTVLPKLMLNLVVLLLKTI